MQSNIVINTLALSLAHKQVCALHMYAYLLKGKIMSPRSQQPKGPLKPIKEAIKEQATLWLPTPQSMQSGRNRVQMNLSS
jgi:hypothetical protein